MRTTKQPKGTLIAIGGGEARGPQDNALADQQQQVSFDRHGVLQGVLALMKGPATSLLVIAAASTIPEEMIQLYQQAFTQLGCQSIVPMLAADQRSFDHPDNLALLQQVDGVFLTGGDQHRLVDSLSGTAFLRQLQHRYQQEAFVIAGTSAGAAAMTRLMMQQGTSGESLTKGMVATQPGLGLLRGALIDTHFWQRGRLTRLTEALLAHPHLVGIGLDIDTGVIITQGNHLHAIGSGVVTIVEVPSRVDTNYQGAAEREPIYVEQLLVRLLSGQAGYRLQERTWVGTEAPKGN